MNELPEIDNFQYIFHNDIPLIDTRAPVEFERGAFPNTLNIPLMNDEERHLVGLDYKNNGRNSAIDLGYRLISGDIKKNRMDAWLDFVKKHPNGALFCFRGGLRSEIAQKWIFDSSGIKYPRVKGGYKNMRRYLTKELEQLINIKNFLVIGGQTGCGKTLLLSQLENSIDLEKLANHRGSAFGQKIFPQPTQIDFENALAIEFIHKKNTSILIIEDEGNNIGRVYLPTNLKNKSMQADLVILCASMEERIQLSLKTYVVDMLDDFQENYKTDGFKEFSNYWKNSLTKIQKRLGGLRYKFLFKMLNNAIERHHTYAEIDLYIPLIKALLTDYYDPMYDYQISKKRNRIVFQGDSKAVIDFIKD